MRLDATDPKTPGWHKYWFTCDCVETHFLLVEWWDESDSDWPGYLEVNEVVYVESIWGRIKKAVSVLRGQRTYFGGVVLDTETTDRLIETLTMQREAAKRKETEAKASE